ncbi:hypothetical protein QYS49_37920 [Marivirga salinae]|uniref:Uncharacterized protein n=1 Tax=Marivirga salinarum TaxID=3059078 RepID=A0AA51REA5_9BACT|nr:hypothetical protein [Marivirga sp. BDSF4-3]WMN11310.1 hypothetical protein QYS49_37920 [Marivirga sp. BDSF4-3]
MRKFVFILFAVLLISGLIGYFYFDKKFTPPQNQLNVSDHQDTIPIKWVSSQDSKYAALLLPVKLDGITDTFYLQFDLGAHSTLFHEEALQSIIQKHPFLNSRIENENDPFKFKLGEIPVFIPKVKRINYGKPINWTPSATNIIGTLGSDILEHKVVVFDFKQHIIRFCNSFPKDIAEETIQDFEFKKRKVMLNGKINDDDTQFYYDSGSSAFELITDKKQWENLSLEGAVEQTYQANSWGKPLEVHNISSNAIIKFGKEEISLNKVTYIEGTSVVQNLLMYFSGMGGMIGNKLFIDKTLVLDARNQKFAVF